ncbi:MAG: V-type ATP synthase subunit I [Candidatus Methanoperedens sp.]|nr:V-type ATP synthase subunit I [Candidatus Methanoperedens sp.]
MLKPTRMTRVVIAGTKDLMESVISTFHDLNLLHITDYSEESETFKIGKPLKPASKMSEYLLSLRSISNQLGIIENESQGTSKTRELQSRMDEKISTLQKEVSSRFDEMRDLESRIKEKEDIVNSIKPFFGLPLSLESYSGYGSLKVYIGYIDNDLDPKLSKITNNYELFIGESEKRKIFALFIPTVFADEVQKLLQDERSYSELKVPGLKGNPPVVLEALSREISDLEQKYAKTKAELENIKKEYSEFIIAADEYLSIETQKAEVPLKFATSTNAFIIDGWIPTSKYDEMEKELQKNTGGLVHIVKNEEKANNEDIPVELENPTSAKPFELLIDTFATPKYTEIDPSAVLFITFPLFYGIMLGDVGYGIIVAAMAYFIKSKFKTGGLNSLALILFLSGILSTFFGFIFGEFFGFPIFNMEVHGEMEHGLLGIAGPAIASIHMPIHRFGEVQSLLLLTFAIGIIHILLGLILGFRNYYEDHGLKHAILAKGSWMMILIGGVLLIAKLMPAVTSKLPVPTGDPVFMVGAVLAIVGLILLIAGEGFISILEIPTILSNVLSYSRILAIGLSSAGIALVVNTLSMDLFIRPDGELLGGGIVLALVGVVILFIGHVINLLLGILGPGLHSLRLQYVEFFTKFYEGGGKKYVPFGYKRKYTED